MTDELVKRLRNKTRDSILKENDRVEAADRIEQLTAERDAAYASGYSDAETEISKSALGQKNAFLHSQYANAVDHIKVLTAERDRLLEALTELLEISRRAVRLSVEHENFKLYAMEPMERAILLSRAALKGESHE